MGKTLKRRVHEWVEVVPAASGGGRFALDPFDAAMIVLIVANVAAVMLETVAAVQARYGRALFVFECVSIAAFTVEYALRLWACAENPKYARPVAGRLRFAVTPMALIDLLAILPFYLQFVVRADLRFILALRLLRMLRVLKLGRYSAAARTLGRVLRSKREELAVMALVTSVVLVVASGLMYYAEHEHQPEKFSSIPASMWWAVITLTTIGYGDVFPVSPLGQALGGMIAVCGIGLVALPTAIVSAGFAEEIAQRRKVEARCCPHCGKLPTGEGAAAAPEGGGERG
jgi:voltage-gated potassium channel